MDWAIVVLSGGLVAATAVLAWFTRDLVTNARLAWTEAQNTRGEMERTRQLSVRPILAFDPHVVGGMIGMLLVRNVGRGPALEVTLRFDYWGTPREWFERSVEPGESHQFKLPAPFEADIWKAKDIELEITIEGRMRDLDGHQHEISDVVDLTAWVRAALSSGERIVGRRKIAGADPD